MKLARRLLALILIASLCAGTISMTAFAAQTDVKTETIYNEDETTTYITTTTTTEVDPETGNTVVTVEIKKETSGTNNDGAVVTGEEKTVEKTITDKYGNKLGFSWVTDGSEKKEWTEQDTGDGAQPSVTAPIVPGETTTGTAGVTSETVTNADGSVTTTTTDRTVTAEASEIKTTINVSKTGLIGEQEIGLNGITPVYDETDNVVYRPDGKIHDGYGKGGMFDRNYLTYESKYTDTDNWEMPEGADLRYVGTGEHCIYYNARVTVTYEEDEDGAPVIKITKNDGTPITINGEIATELTGEITLKPVYDDYNGGRPTTFMLMDQEGNKVFAYCCDMDTSANKGTWYSVSNLEDSDYFASEESEEHIRTIVMNGYWGTSDIPDENGNYEIGSLEGIKQSLRNAINNNEMENEVIQMPKLNADGTSVLDEEGNPVMESKTMLELIDELTEGEALLATQSAIWSYSNGSLAVQNGKDGVVVVDPDGYKWNHDPNSGSKTWTDSYGNKWDLGTLDDFGSARVDFLYKWLINLETEEESTIVINEKNFIDNVSITVKDKVEEHQNNLDVNVENDVYNTDLNFTLAFVPGENDDLLVQITYKDLDGNQVNVVKRLAGENAEGQNYAAIEPEADGSYVISGLQLSENENFNFDIRLEGTQYLENGVYVYEAVGGRGESQTFVGMAEGTRNVDVSASMTIKFDVDEDNHVVAERKWHNEGDPGYPPENDPPENDPPENDPPENDPPENDPPENDPPENDPLEEIPDEPIPLADIPEDDTTVEIPDGDIPLADVPQTGDMSIIWFGISALSGLGLAGIKLFGKKKDDEE